MADDKYLVNGSERVCVLGAGSWGTTVANLISRSTKTILWARSQEIAQEINENHTNSKYLANNVLSADLGATHQLDQALYRCTLIVVAVPSHGVRAILEAACTMIDPRVPTVSLTKGIEAKSNLRMTQVISEVTGVSRVGFLTGPNLAGEVIEGQPTASVIATTDDELGALIQRLVHSKTMLVYRNRDVVGSEIAGALKNVMAIAAGMAAGLGFGDNSRAALITRALAEVGRLGVRLGGRPMTFAGLAGLGDLVATCSSPRSRNYCVGRMLGQGMGIDEIMGKMNMVAEGVKTAPVAVELGSTHQVDMPISREISRVLASIQTPGECVANLLDRGPGDELEGIEN